MPFVRGAFAASKLGFWDHWVPGANDTLTRLCKVPYFWGIWGFSANKPAAKSLLTFLSQRPQVKQLVAAGQGYDLTAFAKLHDFKTWADEGPPKGNLYNYPPREDLTASISCAPAPTNIATQMYSQATMTKMIARCTQQGESIDRAIAWASDELEGFMRG